MIPHTLKLVDNIIVLNNIISEFLRPIDLQNIAQIALFAFLNLEVNVCRLFPASAATLKPDFPTQT